MNNVNELLRILQQYVDLPDADVVSLTSLERQTLAKYLNKMNVFAMPYDIGTKVYIIDEWTDTTDGDTKRNVVKGDIVRYTIGRFGFMVTIQYRMVKFQTYNISDINKSIFIDEADAITAMNEMM